MDEIKPRPITSWLYPLLVLVSFLAGLATSYFTRWSGPQTLEAATLEPVARSAAANNIHDHSPDMTALMEQVNPPGGYPLRQHYGDLGPRLIESGVIDYEAFAALYQNAGNPLTDAQIAALKLGSDDPILFTAQNAHYLLNFFWAVGLVSRNPILTDGPIVQYSEGRIDRFASTGGWTLGSMPVVELYASADLIPLTTGQQARLEEVASAVFRPCCNNPTHFPDCNHGMAMLGLLEWMASQDASVDEMFEAAKYANAYWFPQQALETAVFLTLSQGTEFAQADGRLVTGKDFFSGSGFGSLHQQLQANGLLPQADGSGGSCAN